MGLSKYIQKRNFKESPEPKGGKPDGEQLRFVVQMHDASHLHYDFRLEMEGVLKSWAVPKGPSMDPKVKRLAVEVEDHPYDYRNFEGIIPSGYGEGTVIVWDEGFYEPMEFEDDDKDLQDKNLRHQLHKGKIKFVLKGKKLKGEFALIKAHGRGENQWLLMKLDDKYATEKDVLTKDKSVISKKTLKQIEKNPPQIYGEKTAKSPSRKSISGSEKKKKNSKEVKSIIDDLPTEKFPTSISPMLATLVNKSFDNSDWIFEIKWDGYRTLAFLNRGNVDLKSRNNKSFNEKFYPIFNTLKKWTINAVFDGEVIVADENGISNFGQLQQWRSEADGELMYYIFDILWFDGKDLTGLPLLERQEILKKTIPAENNIRISEVFNDSGIEFFDAAKKMGLEGIIAKKSDSLYHLNARSKEWLKIKNNRRQEMVIGGFTKNEGTSKTFSALLVGVYDQGKLVFTGKIGTGFSEKMQADLIKTFEPLITKKSPFLKVPDVNKPSRFKDNSTNATVFWLKPALICEVSFTEMTADRVMRHASFEGMRIDKSPKEITLETAKKSTSIVTKQAEKIKKVMKVSTEKLRKSLLNPTDETQVRKINGNEIKFTNLSKIYWPDDKITKRDLLNYYYQAAPFILPYLKDRPQSLLRHPNGIEGNSFFQKDVTATAPDWVETYLYHSADEVDDKHYLVATNEASLLYMATLGCIEMNPWNSTVKKPEKPTWCIIDLDPAKKTTFDQVIEAAQITKSVLDNLGVESYCKTSGSTGLHIYIPLGNKYDYELSKEFARIIATLVHEEIPEFTSLERSIKDRKGKMYIDFLQNRPHATVSAPYSVRPKPYATVSMPLHWDEVKKGLKMRDFTIKNAIDRMQNEGDIFKPVLGKGINLKQVLKNYEKKYSD